MLYLTVYAVNAQNFPIPKSIVIGDIHSNYGVIFPIGWSHDGRFGYITQDINDLSDKEEVFTYHLIIQDMITDSVLVDEVFNYNYKDCRECRTKYAHVINADRLPFKPSFFEKFVWPKLKIHVMTELLARQVAPVPLEYAPISKDLTGFPIELREQKSYHSDSSCIREYAILAKKDITYKQVYQFSNPGDSCVDTDGKSINAMEFYISGYFHSPFDERTAVIVLRKTSSDLGKVVHPISVGIHLDRGFTED